MGPSVYGPDVPNPASASSIPSSRPFAYPRSDRRRLHISIAAAAPSNRPPSPIPTPRPTLAPVESPPSLPLSVAKTEPGPKAELLACAKLDEAALKAELLTLDTEDSTAALVALEEVVVVLILLDAVDVDVEAEVDRLVGERTGADVDVVDAVAADASEADRADLTDADDTEATDADDTDAIEAEAAAAADMLDA